MARLREIKMAAAMDDLDKVKMLTGGTAREQKAILKVALGFDSPRVALWAWDRSTTLPSWPPDVTRRFLKEEGADVNMIPNETLTELVCRGELSRWGLRSSSREKMVSLFEEATAGCGNRIKICMIARDWDSCGAELLPLITKKDSACLQCLVMQALREDDVWRPREWGLVRQKAFEGRCKVVMDVLQSQK